jgi:hypothetical protein
VPPKADAQYVWRMEDVIQTYLLPYDPNWPVVCFDEACKQLFGEVRPQKPPRPGRPARVDYEYERKGVCHQLVMCEPLRGWRHVKVTRSVQDNLNTHDGASLYEAFPPAEARRILDKIEWHYTPKHGSWVNMAETEISVMNSQCLDRRLDSAILIAQEVAAWEGERNARGTKIHWTFTPAAARQKLRKLYPSIEG